MMYNKSANRRELDFNFLGLHFVISVARANCYSFHFHVWGPQFKHGKRFK